jgi:3'(2'), 5'-bisphosphate nucleotidase
MLNDRELLIMAIEAAIYGGDEILNVYQHDFEVEFKEDKSPLTLADRRAHEAISKVLERSGLPILSEEGKNIPFETRKDWKKFWLVDPLDGTKEFVKRNGEFTVNIALIINGNSEMGVIYVPVSKTLYFASGLTGACKAELNESRIYTEDIITNATALPLDHSTDKLTVVCSRSHMSPETHEYIQVLINKGLEPEYVSIGSSLKMCLIAEGKAQVYPRFGPTMEWDTAAGHAIVEKSGGTVITADQTGPVTYNKENLLNPWFIASRPY